MTGRIRRNLKLAPCSVVLSVVIASCVVADDRAAHDCPAPDAVRTAYDPAVTKGEAMPECLQACHVDLYVSHVDSVLVPEDTRGAVFNMIGVIENDLLRDLDLSTAFFARTDSDSCAFVIRNGSTAILAPGTAAGLVSPDAAPLVAGLLELPWVDDQLPSLDFDHARESDVETCKGLLWVDDVCVPLTMTVEYSANTSEPQRVTAARSQGQVWPCLTDLDERTQRTSGPVERTRRTSGPVERLPPQM